MRNIFIILALLSIVSSGVCASELSSLIGDIQDQLTTQVATFYGPVKAAAQYIFYSLAVIEMVWVFGYMAMRGDLEFGGVIANVVKMMLLITLFNMIFLYPGWMESVWNGFNTLADQANGGTTPSLDGIMGKVGDFWAAVWERAKDNGVTGIGDTLMVVAFAVIATLFISLMLGKALQYYVFFLFSLYVGIFWVGFGSLSFTRQWAFNAIINVVRQGAKWMLMMMIIGVTFSLISTAISNGINDPVALIALGVVSMIMWGFSNGVDSWVDSYFTGHGGGENNYLGQKLQAAATGGAAGAAAGAAASLSQVQAAAAAGETSQTTGSNNGGNTPGGSGSTGTEKKGNFINSAKNGAKNTAAVAAGAIGGATTGMLKGAMGFSTHNAGAKTGAGAGKSINVTSNAAKKLMGNNKANETEKSLITESLAEGSISSADSSYISAVPGESNE